MAGVHSNFVDLMDRLIAKHGRDVSIRRQTGTTLKDPARPEGGLQPAYTDTATKAVFLDADKRDLLLSIPGQPDELTRVQRSLDRFVLVAAKNLSFEVETAHQIVDGSRVLEITEVDPLKPGPTLIGFVIQVAR